MTSNNNPAILTFRNATVSQRAASERSPLRHERPQHFLATCPIIRRRMGYHYIIYNIKSSQPIEDDPVLLVAITENK